MTKGNNAPKRRERPFSREVRALRSELIGRYGTDWIEFAQRWLRDPELEVLKRRYEGQTQREVGSALGLPDWHVGNLERRARRKLKHCLHEHGRDGYPQPSPEPKPVEDLGLRPRIVEALLAAEVTTLDKLVALRPREVRRISGIGPRSLEDIEACLMRMGLVLKQHQ